jgi:signal transduction histidine kinase
VSPLAGLASAQIERARADQVAMAYASLPRTTASMLLGGALLAIAMRGQVGAAWWLAWFALVALNQLWRWRLTAAFRRADPGASALPRWGSYWAAGSTLGGALWGLAAVVVFPASEPHQALLIVCLFGVALAGVNLTAVWRASFYGFVLAALVPLIARVAWEGDPVHLDTAAVMAVVLAFVLAFGHRVNDLLTQALAIRHENVDLIGELKAQTRVAVDARAAAETADRAKSQLLAAASHDLRQPLHAVGLYVSALAARTGEPEVRAIVGRTQQALDALDAQFGQLIDLSRLEAGALAPQRDRVPLAPLLAALAAEFRPQAEAKGVRLIAVPTRLAVDSDPALLGRILRNLVSNAVRYTRSGGVVVGARRRGNAVAIEVVDTGAGIAPEHRERIFEEFYQVRRPATPGGRGMGLGLAIVRRFADLLGHAVTVRSQPGRGSRFAVVAPRVTDVRSIVSRPATNDGACAEACLAGTTIAVVDDDPASVEAMRSLFLAWGADVAGGGDAREALRALGRLERYPDLIIADLRLDHGASGLDAVTQLRDELGMAIPALVVSGDVSPEAARSVRSAGLAMLAKPVVPATLAGAASVLLAQAQPAPTGRVSGA